MDKSDWYFALSTFFDFLAFLRLDWKSLRGDGMISPARKRQLSLLVLIALSLIFSLIGWYQNPESIAQVEENNS